MLSITSKRPENIRYLFRCSAVFAHRTLVRRLATLKSCSALGSPRQCCRKCTRTARSASRTWRTLSPGTPTDLRVARKSKRLKSSSNISSIDFELVRIAHNRTSIDISFGSEALARNVTLLVTCAGVSRSPALAAACVYSQQPVFVRS